MSLKRFCQRGHLKPEKAAEYRSLHASVWPQVRQIIHECNLRNYSIYIMGNEVISYFEYVGEDYVADMAKMACDAHMQEWWTHTKPCFLLHEEAVYYEDMEEIFYQE